MTQAPPHAQQEAVPPGQGLGTTLARDAVRSVPNLVILLALAWLFLQYLDRQNGAFAKSLESVGASCHAHNEKSSERVAELVHQNGALVEKMGRALDENSRLLGQVLEALRSANDRRD